MRALMDILLGWDDELNFKCISFSHELLEKSNFEWHSIVMSMIESTGEHLGINKKRLDIVMFGKTVLPHYLRTVYKLTYTKLRFRYLSLLFFYKNSIPFLFKSNICQVQVQFLTTLI